MKLSAIIPNIVATITGAPRYRPKIEWSSTSITHNVFRLWELVAGRRKGIRLEVSAGSHKNRESDREEHWQYAHTFEASCALFEYMVRNVFAFRPVAIRISIPVFRTPEGMVLPASPYLFALGYDAKASGSQNSTTSLSYSHTVSGSDRWIGVSQACHVATATFSGTTYNSVSATQVDQHAANNNTRIGLYGLAAPATGANNVVVNVSASDAIRAFSYSFTGVDQTTPVDASVVAPRTSWTSVTTFNPSVTATQNDCMGVLAFFADSGPALTAGANTSLEVQEATAYGTSIARNTASVGATTTVQITMTSSSQGFAGVLAALGPAAATATFRGFFNLIEKA